MKCVEDLFFSNNCLAMGEHVEKLFQRKHNQLNDSEVELVYQYKKEIVPRITHVIDCEAYYVKFRFVMLERGSVNRIRYICQTPLSVKNIMGYDIRYTIFTVYPLYRIGIIKTFTVIMK